LTRKLYWENPYLFEARANVISTDCDDEECNVVLDKTIFYPDMSGGQPGDIGTIGEQKVLRTFERGSDIVHVLKSQPRATNVSLNINPDRRFDLMQQHTGQHLLSGVLYRLFKYETISFHLGEDYATIDLNCPAISDEELEQTERLCNKIIQSNFEVKSYFVSRDKVKYLPVRKPPTVDEDIRIVEIEGFDFSPCGGTHLSGTGELGLIKILKTEKYKGNVRMYFLCGKRALKDYFNRYKATREIGAMLSAGDSDLVEKFTSLYDEKEGLQKENRELKERLISLECGLLLTKAQLFEEVNLVHEIFDGRDFKSLNSLGNQITSNNEKTLIVFGTTGEEHSQFIISKSRDFELDLSELYKSISSTFSVKGGGNSNTVQGSVDKEQLNDLIEYSIELIKIKLNKKL
jgi:alanyl-tRNA synthetase